MVSATEQAIGDEKACPVEFDSHSSPLCDSTVYFGNRPYENDLDYVKDVLHEGNRRANEIADQTLAEVQDAMGMVY